MTVRDEIGAVQRRSKVIAACHDADSLWVEVAGPKGGDAWQMTPAIAREVAGLLVTAADRAEVSA